MSAPSCSPGCLCACSAVLPVSSAFASTGIVAGFVIMVVVAAANAYTCDLLLWQAYKTGMHDYETLSYAVGGGLWKVCIVLGQKRSLPLSELELQACNETG